MGKQGLPEPELLESYFFLVVLYFTFQEQRNFGVQALHLKNNDVPSYRESRKPMANGWDRMVTGMKKDTALGM